MLGFSYSIFVYGKLLDAGWAIVTSTILSAGFLKNVPFAILGALIFPSILLIQKDIWYGILEAAAAFIAAFLGANVMIVVLGSISVLAVYSCFL